MFNFSLPRGIIYHRLIDDFKWLLMSLFSNLNKVSTINKFEYKFANLLGRKYCLAFPFARTAIYFALKAKNFPRGSEIIMPPISIKGILDVVLYLEMKPIFVDINPETLCFDEGKLQEAISNNTKAIIITYLYGIVPDIRSIVSICKKKQLFILEDFSQCLNGTYDDKKVGTFGNVGIYSSSSIKTLDTYGGGLLILDDDSLYRKLASYKSSLTYYSRSFLVNKILTDFIRNLLTKKIVFTFFTFPLIRLIARIKPESIIKQTGNRDEKMISSLPKIWFSSFTSFQAYVGLNLIDNLMKSDALRINNVKKIKKSNYSEFPKGVKKGRNVYWQLAVFFNDTYKAQKKFQKYNIDTARTSLLQISNLKDYPFQAYTPVASSLYEKVLFVPCYPSLSQSDIRRVVNCLDNIHSSNYEE
jgi:dTDP-4-amino-4,6-dideoxygalactose transaminase